MGETISILIADDHAASRASVREALVRAEDQDFTIVAEVADADKAVAAAREHHPDVCLLDINMPGSGIAAARQITSSLPDTTVVMLTVSRQDDDLFDSLRAGASGYLLKDTDPARLPHALRGVLTGEAALPRGLVTRVIDEFRGRRRVIRLAGRRQPKLSSREWEVLDFMRAGLTTAEMAERMFVSKVTVRSHVASILRKLRVADRDAALKLFNKEDE